MGYNIRVPFMGYLLVFQHVISTYFGYALSVRRKEKSGHVCGEIASQYCEINRALVLQIFSVDNLHL